MAFTQNQIAMRPYIDPNTKNIVNLSKILDLINEETDSKFLEDYLMFQKRFLEGNHQVPTIEDLGKIIDSVELRLATLKSNDLNNKDTLEALQKINPAFKSLSIITTNKENNDSKKDIELIRWYEEGMDEPEYLECYGKSTINDYLQLHPEFIENGSPKELFNYYKEYVHQPVKSKNISDVQANSDQQSEYNLDPEIQAIKEYAKSQNNDSDVIVYTDSNNEKYYNVGDKTYKFRTNVYGKREIYLVDNLEKKEENQVEENTDKENEIIHTNYSETSIADYTTDIQNAMDLEAAKNLLINYINGGNVKETTKQSLARFFIKSINEVGIENMDKETIDMLDAYIIYIEDLNKAKEISEEEKKVVDAYHKNINKNNEQKAKKEAEAKNNGEVKVLTMKPVKEQNKGHVATIILIIVVLIIATILTTSLLIK